MSLISVDSQTRPLCREPYLVEFDRDGSVEDRSFQGGVSDVRFCCAGKCRIPSDPLTLSLGHAGELGLLFRQDYVINGEHFDIDKFFVGKDNIVELLKRVEPL